MEAIKNTFCDDPMKVYVLLALVFAVLAAWWYVRRTPQVLKLLAVPLVLGGAVFATDYFVETDREALERIAQEIAVLIEQGEYSQVIGWFDENYDGFGGDYKGIKREAVREKKRSRILKVSINKATIEVNGKFAKMWIVTKVGLQKSARDEIFLEWDIHWIKKSEGWRIKSASEPRMYQPKFGQ